MPPFILLFAVFLITSFSAQAADSDALARIRAGEDCVKCDLKGADFSRADLSGRNLGGAFLDGATM
jgi:uncharacterized protein YjbI with pentapeptide repeats